MRNKWHGNPTSTVWILIHVVMMLIGFLLIAIAAREDALYSTPVHGVGASLVATGLAGMFLYLFLRMNNNLQVQLNSMIKAGITNIFEGRSTGIRNEYDSRIERAKRIDILGFGLHQFREDHLRNFERWSNDKTIRILLLDPEYPSQKSSYAQQRDSEEKKPAGTIPSEIRTFVSDVKKLQSLNKENFHVRYMTALPSINIFRIDDELFWGPYLMHEESRNTPTILTRRGGHLFQTLSNHFDSLWNERSRSTEV